MRTLKQNFRSLSIFLSLVFCVTFANAQGLMFRGAGAVNQSMGGASTAAPLSAAGAMYWNPATMSALYGTTVDVDLGIALPESTISSTLPNGMGGGTMESDTGAIPIPNVAIVRRRYDSPFAVGFSFGATGGAKTNYTSASLTDNPILSDSSYGYGYGQMNSSVQLLQVAANLSYSVTEKFSLAIGPTLNMCELTCDPLYVVPGHSAPDAAIRGTGTRYHFGAGFQVGAFYDTLTGWRFGVSYKSRGWMESFTFTGTDGKEYELDLDSPSIISFGLSWYGWERWTFAWDFRYLMYEKAGFDQVGWKNMFAFCMGVQYQVNERLSLRAGYSMNDNQLSSSFTRACVVVPLIPQHALFLGGSYRFTENITFSLTYAHIFRATSSGCYFGPGMEAYGGDVTISAEANEITAGVSFNF